VRAGCQVRAVRRKTWGLARSNACAGSPPTGPAEPVTRRIERRLWLRNAKTRPRRASGLPSGSEAPDAAETQDASGTLPRPASGRVPPPASLQPVPIESPETPGSAPSFCRPMSTVRAGCELTLASPVPGKCCICTPRTVTYSGSRDTYKRHATHGSTQASVAD